MIGLKEFVESNPKLVMLKETSFPGVYCLKYRKRVFFDALWNDYLENCRGTLVDKDYNIVSLPFKKIYNYGVEERAPVLPDDEVVMVSRKVNGFMVAVTYHDETEQLIISTTGSTDSDFVQYAKDMIGANMKRYETVCWRHPEYTFLFECVHPKDPHIIDEAPGMYLLGYRKKEWDSLLIEDVLSEYSFTMFEREFKTNYCKHHVYLTVGQVKDLVKHVKHKGYTFYTLDGKQSSKIKSPHYLQAKFLARCNNTTKLLDRNIKARMEEEFYHIIDAVQSNVDWFLALTEQERLNWINNKLG